MAGPMISMISSCEKVTILGGTYGDFVFGRAFLVLTKVFCFRFLMISPTVMMINHASANSPAKNKFGGEKERGDPAGGLARRGHLRTARLGLQGAAELPDEVPPDVPAADEEVIDVVILE